MLRGEKRTFQCGRVSGLSKDKLAYPVRLDHSSVRQKIQLDSKIINRGEKYEKLR